MTAPAGAALPERDALTGHLTLYLTAPTVQDALEAVRELVQVPPTKLVRKVSLTLTVELGA